MGVQAHDSCAGWRKRTGHGPGWALVGRVPLTFGHGTRRSRLTMWVGQATGPADCATAPQTTAFSAVAHHAVASIGGCWRTRGRYSTSWIRSSKVLLAIMSSATSG